jgi:hypothetical protein
LLDPLAVPVDPEEDAQHGYEAHEEATKGFQRTSLPA